MRSKETLQLDDLIQYCKVKRRNLSPDSSVIGTKNDNSILDNLTCDVEFEDRQIREHMINTISENMLTRADANGHVTI